MHQFEAYKRCLLLPALFPGRARLSAKFSMCLLTAKLNSRRVALNSPRITGKRRVSVGILKAYGRHTKRFVYNSETIPGSFQFCIVKTFN